MSWSNFTYNFAVGGTHTLRWRYFKDEVQDEGSDLARIDNIILTRSAPAAIRIVDGNQGEGKVLVSDANGNAIWTNLSTDTISDIPNVTTIDTMEIPICNDVAVGSTGSFTTTIRGTVTTVLWEVLQQQTNTGSTATLGSGETVLLAPFRPERLQVRYDFSPALPFNPQGLIFTANNDSAFPDTFGLNYAQKSPTSVIVNITRTDTLGDTSSTCWTGQFFFDVLITGE